MPHEVAFTSPPAKTRGGDFCVRAGFDCGLPGDFLENREGECPDLDLRLDLDVYSVSGHILIVLKFCMVLVIALCLICPPLGVLAFLALMDQGYRR
jgi:hypothetical protein